MPDKNLQLMDGINGRLGYGQDALVVLANIWSSLPRDQFPLYIYGEHTTGI